MHCVVAVSSSPTLITEAKFTGESAQTQDSLECMHLLQGMQLASQLHVSQLSSYLQGQQLVAPACSRGYQLLPQQLGATAAMQLTRPRPRPAEV